MKINFLDTKEKKQQFIISYFVFAMNGMLALSIGSLLPFIRSSRMLDYAFAGMLVSLHSVGNLCSSFISGMLPVVIGRKKTILIFSSFFSISFFLLLVGNNAITLILAFFMTGLARGAASNFNNTTINNLAPGKVWTINALHAMFSLGAFAFPLILTAITISNSENWIYVIYMMLGIGIVNFILYLWIPIEKKSLEKKAKLVEKKKADFSFFKEPLFWLCTGILFFYLCAEQGVIGWMITYFEDAGLLSASISQIMASILWIMILSGRLSVAWISTKVKRENLVVFMGIGFVLFFVILIFSRSTEVIILGILGFGYSMAGIYPTIVSTAGHINRKFPLSWSFMLTLASMGSILMPSVIGRIADLAGIIYGMSSIIVVVVIDLVLIGFLYRYIKKHGIQ